MTKPLPAYPTQFRFYAPVQVRYGDLDTLRHVNNVAIAQYVETARIQYYQASGIWDGEIRQGFGMVVASMRTDFLQSVTYNDREVRVGLLTSHLGNKSIRFRFQVESKDGERIFARGEVVTVAYDVQTGKSVNIWPGWREKLAAFEDNPQLLKRT